MKYLVLVAALLFSSIATAQTFPSAGNIKLFTSRANLYISMGQKPSQVIQSLKNYYGKDYFMARSNGWDQTVDIVVQIGGGTEIVYYATLVTMPAE